MKFNEQDILWYQRRRFLLAAAAFAGYGLNSPAIGQSRSNIVELVGDAQLNGTRMRSDDIVQTGDRIRTGPNSRVTLVIGASALHLRQNTQLEIGRGAMLNFISVLRLVSGAMATVFEKDRDIRRIRTATATIGIRGTGVYTEAQPERTYFCNCYGTTDVIAGTERIENTTQYHDSFWASSIAPRNGKAIWKAPALNHGDEELEMLARLVQQPVGWAGMPEADRTKKMGEKSSYRP
jgi:hypothetical protein